MAAQNPPYVIQGQSHPADGFRRAVKALREAVGVVLTGDMAVTQNGSPNMSVNVAAGQGVIDGTENTTLQGTYEVTNDATVNLAIAASDPTNPRNDLVVAKVQDSNYSGGTQAWSLVVVTGTPAGSPVDPATPANAIVLARVRVDATVTSIVNAKITDLRTFTHGSISPGGSGLTVYASDGSTKNLTLDDLGRLLTRPGAGQLLNFPVQREAETIAVVPQQVFSTPANPANTVSTVGVMAGLATVITPQVTGRILIILVGTVSNNTASDSSDVQLRYGTGAAPGNGAALTGTAVGSAVRTGGNANSAALQFGFGCIGIVTGLTLGTAYWIDAMEKAIGGGTTSLFNIALLAIEI